MKCEALFLATFLLNIGSTAAFDAMNICYILDGILFVYGIVLTVLYCRLKLASRVNGGLSQKKPQEEGIYTGLTPHAQDTYETIRMQKGMA
ncbi:hypothetical protein COCON_G00137160 [Conger conger]|uniref:Fc receptor gamma-chain n=1 Tax=Conger conger TaxID=82655 RepID=A0A9Q1DEY2_CONCO|nr:high affinity immunoglobulin epsilon receptor subunit gamma-like [Conger conger]KAJ8268544.1 hypothetical protein COCON_G00137160 [Conger conger]